MPTEAGEPLIIVCEKAIQIRLPTEMKSGITYFDGSISRSGFMNWELSDSINPFFEETVEVHISEEPIQVLYEEKLLNTYFPAQKASAGSIGDRFYDDSCDKTDLLVNVVLPDYEKNITETYNYIVFDSFMSVLPVYLDDSGQWICPSLPMGEVVTCISIQKISSQSYYSGIQKLKLGDPV